jgi:hypothetical protein
MKKIGWNTIFKYLNNVLDMSEDKSLLTIKRLLVEELQDKALNVTMLNNNIAVTNIDEQCNAMGEIDTGKIITQIRDVPDYENFAKLNQAYFTRYQIHLEALTQQTNNVNTKPKWV